MSHAPSRCGRQAMDESTQGSGGVMTGRARIDVRLAEHVDRLAFEHPPIELASVDYTVRQPLALRERYGHVLAYMARVELEVERNVRELTALVPRQLRSTSLPRRARPAVGEPPRTARSAVRRSCLPRGCCVVEARLVAMNTVSRDQILSGRRPRC